MIEKITLEHIAQAKKPDGEEGNNTLNRMNSSHDELTNWALSYLPSTDVSKVLDVGCGGGATIARLINKYPDSFVNGIDYSNTSVDLSRKYNQDILGIKCDVCQADVKELPFADKSFDLITAFETVYFWGDLNRAFSEIHRCLKSDGVFLICCEMSDNNNPRWGNVLNEMHINSIEVWSEILDKSDFKIISSNRLYEEWICLVVTPVK